LAQRKLFPSLYNLHKQGLLPEAFQILAVSRRGLTDYHGFLKEAVSKFRDEQLDLPSWERFVAKVEYISGDFQSDEVFKRINQRLNEIDKGLKVCAHKIFYLAISPDLFGRVFESIKTSELQLFCQSLKHSRVVVEKPFGKDKASFNELNSKVLSVFAEEQVYRIDHYLGKETVQNILYFKAANPFFSGDWNSDHIERIEFNVLESIGIGKRGGYYDAYGQMRDMVQSHALQLVALTLMTLPEELTAEAVKQKKTEVLDSLELNKIYRGQYLGGVVDGNQVKAYREEEGVGEHSNTETYVKIEAVIKDGPWKGLRVDITAGKRMREKLSEIIIHYKESKVVSDLGNTNKLIFRLQPHEGITLKLNVKKPGVDDTENVDMTFDYQDTFQAILPDAYEKILLDVIRLRRNLFLGNQELEAAWAFVEPIIKGWQTTTEDLIFYPAGSSNLEDF